MGKSCRVLSPNSCSGKRQYKGVRRRTWGSWVSEIRAPHQKTKIWLGSYSTPEAAARAYDAALLCLKGSSASFNFPIALPSYLPAAVMSPKSIQRVAATAATSPMVSQTITLSPSPSPSLPPSSFDTNEDNQSKSTSLTTSTMSEKLDEFWIDLGAFQSPKCTDHMINPLGTSWEECEEMGDINLWSFF